MRGNLREKHIKDEMVNLSVAYNLASPHTRYSSFPSSLVSFSFSSSLFPHIPNFLNSFVAVEDRKAKVQETMQQVNIDSFDTLHNDVKELNEQFRDLVLSFLFLSCPVFFGLFANLRLYY